MEIQSDSFRSVTDKTRYEFITYLAAAITLIRAAQDDNGLTVDQDLDQTLQAVAPHVHTEDERLLLVFNLGMLSGEEEIIGDGLQIAAKKLNRVVFTMDDVLEIVTAMKESDDGLDVIPESAREQNN